MNAPAPPQQGIASEAVEAATDAIRRVIIRDGELADVRDMARAAILAMRQVEAPDVGELREVLEMLRQEDDHIMDGGEGPFVELWESDFQRIKSVLERLTSQGGGC